jgi:hypothetical protein
LAFRLTLTRDSSARDLELCLGLLRDQQAYYQGQKMAPQAAVQQAWFELCHMLFNTSEFLYVP